jgi:hypothetical protein
LSDVYVMKSREKRNDGEGRAMADDIGAAFGSGRGCCGGPDTIGGARPTVLR